MTHLFTNYSAKIIVQKNFIELLISACIICANDMRPHNLQENKSNLCIITTRQWSCGKVMFLGRVCHYPWCIAPQCTGTPGSIPSRHGTSLYRDPLTPAPPGHGTSLYRHIFIWGPSTSADIWWLFDHLGSGQVGSTHPTGMLSCFGMHRSLWGISHFGQTKLLNCNEILRHIAYQNYIAIIDPADWAFKQPLEKLIA